MVVGSASASSGASRQGLPSWIGAATAAKTTRGVELDNMPNEESSGYHEHPPPDASKPVSDSALCFRERAFSAAGAAFISAILVNPLDVAKTRLQAQAARVPCSTLCHPDCFGSRVVLVDVKSNPSSTRPLVVAEPTYSPDCSRYKGTFDVFYKIIHQEGFTRLWRGTNASLALAVPSVGIYLPLYDIFRNFMEVQLSENAPSVIPYVPLVAGSMARTIACISCYPVELARTRMQAFKETGAKPSGVWRTLVEVLSPVKGPNNHQNPHTYRILWTGLGAQLARDVPFSAVCWSTLEPARRRILGWMNGDARVGNVFGANFCAGFIAGSLAAAVTCPLDVARTRRQIENDPRRALNMTTKQTLVEIWRDGGVKGLFTGVGPRVARAGPSVGIVVSFYEVVKYVLHQRHLKQ